MSSAGPAAIVLAAGASTRLGEPKQLVSLGGETLLDRAVRVAADAGCAPVVVVLGAAADTIRRHCRLQGATVLLNDAWKEGMASSLRLGVGAVAGHAGAIVLTCDMPAVTPEHLRALAATGRLTASRYVGRVGVPAYLPAQFFPRVLALHGDQGARGLLGEADVVDLPDGTLDVDTPDDVARLRSLFPE